MTLHHSWYAAPLVAACVACLALLVRLDWTPSAPTTIVVESLHIPVAESRRIVLMGMTSQAISLVCFSRVCVFKKPPKGKDWFIHISFF
jgi:hypothetical protein